MSENKIRKIIKEMIHGRRELGSNVQHKKNGQIQNINPKEFDWFSFFNKIEEQMKVLNDKYVLLTIDELKNENKITEIINEFIWLRDYLLSYSTAFLNYFQQLDQPNKKEYENIKNQIIQITNKKTRFEQILFKMYDLIQEMGDIDHKKIF